MQQTKLVQALVGIGLVGLLAACGGGGSSNSSGSGTVTPPVAANGAVNMFVTDGPSDTFQHVWVTVTQISFHTDPNAVWSSSDASWVTKTLATPVTIDLAALNNGALSNVFAGLNLPVGLYKQIRFFFLSDTDPLSSSAQAINDFQSTPLPLQWNDQVEYLNNSAVVSEAPLEIANPVQGIQLLGNFNVTAGAALNLATDFDLDKIIVPFKHGNQNSFTIKPDLQYFNLNNAGAISGNVATANLCAQPIMTSPAATCAFNLVVHAETVSADGTRYQDVRSTTVDQFGNFTLAPLPINDINGNPISYDIIVRGRQMQTLEITGVPSAGTYTFNSSTNTESYTGGTLLQASANPLPVTIETEYATNFGTALSPLTSGHVIFEQTIGSGLPHEIRWADTNPFTGTIDRSLFPLWNQNFYVANSNLNVAPYSANGLTFTQTTPVEGTGNYAAIANEHVYYNFGTGAAVSSNIPNFATNQPTLAANVVSGTVGGTVLIGSLGARADGATVSGADVVLARDGAIISTSAIPFSDLVPTGTFAYSFTGVGAGSAQAPVKGAYYYAYVRLYYGDGSHKTVPMSGYADLRSSNVTPALNVTINE